MRGPKEGKVFWNGSQAAQRTASSQYVFLARFCFLSISKEITIFLPKSVFGAAESLM